MSETRPDGTRTEIYRAWCDSTLSSCSESGALKVLSIASGAPPQVVVSDKYGREITTASIGFDGTPLVSKKS